jgi:hypothetical protein
MRTRATPRGRKADVRQRLREALESCARLIEEQPRAELDRLDSVRLCLSLALRELGRVDERPLKEIRARQRFATAMLEPIMKPHREQWLRGQLEGLGKEGAP